MAVNVIAWVLGSVLVSTLVPSLVSGAASNKDSTTVLDGTTGAASLQDGAAVPAGMNPGLLHFHEPANFYAWLKRWPYMDYADGQGYFEEEKRGPVGGTRNPYSWQNSDRDKRGRNPYAWLSIEDDLSGLRFWPKTLSKKSRNPYSWMAEPKRSRNPYSWMNDA